MSVSYLTPGIYIQEISSGNPSIEAVGTSKPAFLGVAPLATARLDEALAIDSWSQFQKYYIFGEDKFAAAVASGAAPGVTTTPLAQAVKGFFDNGGSRCYVLNLGRNGSLQGSGGARRQGIDLVEEIDEVSMVCTPGFNDARSYQALISFCDRTNRMAICDSPEDVPNSDLLKDVALPPKAPDPKPAGADPKPAGPDPKPATPAAGGLRAMSSDTGNAAYYYPWLTCVDAVDPSSPELVNSPPCGHIAGVYARVDAARGVFKAPANEAVRGALNVVYRVTDPEQGGLNQNGVNVIRLFTGDGLRVWGARTLAGPDKPWWRYINVRRTFTMIERSIKRGTLWAVFEPNDQLLWSRIRVSVGMFLKRMYKSGALMGRSPEEAYFVKCDEETNPPEVIEAGQLVIVVGLAVVKPAEFVVFRIGHYAAGAEKGEAGNG
ncbi:MAG TPA: phage tail sheath subtilisin-like domain-containing protein [Kofleriaceae bacterium]|nr:phage tail sheath subtilisin-like domain-containing protein [Kofleriaceae bacterium]